MKPIYTTLSITKLVPAEWNYKNFSALRMQKLENNIKRNGQLETIIVRELEDGNYEVVNGNHRLEVFKTLGFQDVKVCNLGKISLKQAQRIALETNETRFESDKDKLKYLLSSMTEGPEGFDIDDLSQTLAFEDFETFKLESFDTTVLADTWAEDGRVSKSSSREVNDYEPEANRTVAFIMSAPMYDKYVQLKKEQELGSDYEALDFLLDFYFKQK